MSFDKLKEWISDPGTPRFPKPERDTAELTQGTPVEIGARPPQDIAPELAQADAGQDKAMKSLAEGAYKFATDNAEEGNPNKPILMDASRIATMVRLPGFLGGLGSAVAPSYQPVERPGVINAAVPKMLIDSMSRPTNESAQVKALQRLAGSSNTLPKVFPAETLEEAQNTIKQYHGALPSYIALDKPERQIEHARYLKLQDQLYHWMQGRSKAEMSRLLETSKTTNDPTLKQAISGAWTRFHSSYK